MIFCKRSHKYEEKLDLLLAYFSNANVEPVNLADLPIEFQNSDLRDQIYILRARKLIEMHPLYTESGYMGKESNDFSITPTGVDFQRDSGFAAAKNDSWFCSCKK